MKSILKNINVEHEQMLSIIKTLTATYYVNRDTFTFMGDEKTFKKVYEIKQELEKQNKTIIITIGGL